MTLTAKSFLRLMMLVALTTPAYALTQTSPANESGQYVALHPLPPTAPGDVNLLPGAPVVHTQANIAYISGGIGGGQRAAMRATAPNYNLHLLFAVEGSGAYLSDVKVTAANQQGDVVLDATSDGPYFMAKLPPGTYQITADDGTGGTQTREVKVPAHGAAPISFFWQSSQE